MRASTQEEKAAYDARNVEILDGFLGKGWKVKEISRAFNDDYDLTVTVSLSSSGGNVTTGKGANPGEAAVDALDNALLATEEAGIHQQISDDEFFGAQLHLKAFIIRLA